MTDKKKPEDALDITPAEAAEINSIAHPLVSDPAPDANDDLVQIDATADGVVKAIMAKEGESLWVDQPIVEFE